MFIYGIIYCLKKKSDMGINEKTLVLKWNLHNSFNTVANNIERNIILINTIMWQ